MLSDDWPCDVLSHSDPGEPEVWQCVGCGDTFDGYQNGHARPRHAYDCDGSCRNCPIAEHCGPIVRLGGPHSEEGGK